MESEWEEPTDVMDSGLLHELTESIRPAEPVRPPAEVVVEIEAEAASLEEKQLEAPARSGTWAVLALGAVSVALLVAAQSLVPIVVFLRAQQTLPVPPPPEPPAIPRPPAVEALSAGVAAIPESDEKLVRPLRGVQHHHHSKHARLKR
jgi:hypothetical protein